MFNHGCQRISVCVGRKMGFSSLFLLYILILLSLCSCYYGDTISINKPLKDGSLVISKGGNFALGFFSPVGDNGKSGTSSRYLGIWYNKVPKQTVVWVANRDDPIKDSSGEVSVDNHGNLILVSSHSPGVQLWSTKKEAMPMFFNASAGAAAQLFDSGNLVLFRGGRGMVWQSFDHPTDTILQGMKFGLNRTSGALSSLTSWRSSDDPGTGDYSLKLDPRGSPQLFLIKGTTRREPYWRSAPWPWKKYPHVYNYTFENNEAGVMFSYHTYDPSITIRIVLDGVGILKPMAWHERDGNGDWREFWSAPKLRCDLYAHCGEYGSCDPLRVNTFECSCLPGYEPKNPMEWSLRDGSDGCVSKRVNSSSTCGEGDGFLRLEHVKLPDSSHAIWVDVLLSSSIDLECGKTCLSNCSCSAYAIVNANEEKKRLCLQWHGVLVDTTNRGTTDGYDLYVRVDAVELAGRSTDLDGLPKWRSMVAVMGASVTAAWFVIVSFYLVLRRKRQVKDKANSRRSDQSTDGSLGYRERMGNELPIGSGKRTYHQDLSFFSLSSISAATDDFSPANKLGHGGFGIVYKGQLPDGQEIAVKVLSKNSGQGTEEFENEAELIAKLQHRNLVKLLGCCIEHHQQMLVYEYLANRNETRKVSLDWNKRYNIMVGIARGILYLHQDSRLRVIHRDLKTSNILLDADMNPKISDFGTARMFKGDVLGDRTHRIVGTYGYMSPEYAVLGHFSTKSDVFSFGVVLLEIISGIRINALCEEDEPQNLIGHVWELWKVDMERVMQVVDPSLEDEKEKRFEDILRCIQTALLCVQEKADDRPDMLAVLLMLNGERTLPSPKQPAFIFREHPLMSKQEEEEQCSINQVTITMCLSR
ncbi:unnamed protein product [Linum tenue]|uniref:Receptor-like serine/threonine-protein kinase n=1 Tax=Linum tenue TaxID=586396 RepID=A0AAV0LDW0_9ROSI|nr:unnamed protein product [Linum tenue]